MGGPTIEFRPAEIGLALIIHKIEEESYPPDEAASAEQIAFRLKTAPEYFYVCYLGGELVGFVNGTKCFGETLKHETMSLHEPNGVSDEEACGVESLTLLGAETICVHSVCVSPRHRRKGIATTMLKQYVDAMRHGSDERLKRILLLAHDNLIPLYTKAGFTCRGLSHVVHGMKTNTSIPTY